MKLRNILWLSCALCMLAACSTDDTTNADQIISEITIDETSMSDVYNIDKNETLTIVPQISQLLAGKALKYTWEIDQKVYSNEPELHYVGNELGTFQCRLIVENEDGKTFFPFTLYVNSPYEEGITVVSRDGQGKSMLSFMLKQRDPGIPESFATGDCFAVNNPEDVFADNVIDVLQCDKNLLVVCQGNKETGNPPTIYYLNVKTLVVENKIEVSEYQDFIPYRMLVPSRATAGITFPILCENGKVFEFSSTEGAVIVSAKFKSEYALTGMIYDTGSINYNNIYLWDKNINGISMLYNNYGPYLCCKDYLVDMRTNAEGELKEKSYFNGYDHLLMFIPRTVGGVSQYGDDIVVLTKKGAMYQKVSLMNGFWYMNQDTGLIDFGDYGGMKTAGFSTGITETSPYVASAVYSYLLYGQGNKVMRWIYPQQMLQQATVHCTVGTEQAVITAMELSLDHTETYVAFYEPGESGLNGHVWVIDTEKGTLLRQYDNVCYRPTKMIYKRK